MAKRDYYQILDVAKGASEADIKKAYRCVDGWEKLLKHLGKTRPDDEPLSLLTILPTSRRPTDASR